MTGPAESPPNASPGTGFGLFTLSADQLSLSMNVTFSGLLSNTTAAHIHCCTAVPLAGTAGVATTTPSFAGFPLGVMGGTFVNTLDLTLASSFNAAFVTANGGTIPTARAVLVNGLNSGTSYFNIHSQQFPGGEIRGFITTVPEPSTVLLMASGLIAVGVVARRKARRG